MPAIEVPAKVQNRACFQQWFGGVAVSQEFFDHAMSLMKGMDLNAIIDANEKAGAQSIFNPSVYSLAVALRIAGFEAKMPEAAHDHGTTADESGVPPYVISNGTAIIPVNGPLSKQPSSLQSIFGGSSTVGMRKALGLAMADSRVQRVMFHIDSPGGTVAGTGDLGDDIFAASSKKPVASFIEDMGTSAAYWVASQTATIYASPYANVGSIGVIWTVADTSEAAAKEGIKVHAITSSPGKAFAVDGMPITKQQFAKMQAHVDATYQSFLAAVARGRGISVEAANVMAGDADIYDARTAQQNGLVDRVQSFHDALVEFATATGSPLRLRNSPTSTASGSQAGILRYVSIYTDSTAPDPLQSIAVLPQSPITNAATGAGDGEINTGLVIEHPGATPVTPNPENTAAKDGAAPNSFSPEAIADLQRDAKAGVEALKIVKSMQEQQQKAAAASLDAERERMMADYGLAKEHVQACSDLPALRALEAVARSQKAQRSGADPKGAATGSNEPTPAAEAAAEIADFKATQRKTASTFSSARPVEA